MKHTRRGFLQAALAFAAAAAMPAVATLGGGRWVTTIDGVPLDEDRDWTGVYIAREDLEPGHFVEVCPDTMMVAWPKHVQRASTPKHQRIVTGYEDLLAKPMFFGIIGVVNSTAKAGQVVQIFTRGHAYVKFAMVGQRLASTLLPGMP